MQIVLSAGFILDCLFRAGEGAARQQLEEKRVRNNLIKKELGVKLAFPTYKEGLAAIQSGDKRQMKLF